MITVEEGSIGGFAAHVMQWLALEGLLDGGGLKFRPMTLPDRCAAAAALCFAGSGKRGSGSSRLPYAQRPSAHPPRRLCA